MNTTDKLAEALRAMLTHMGMDEDEWNKPTFDQARAALAAYEAEAKPAEPVAWTLQETLDKRETTCSARLWFTNPRNDAWVPLYTAPAAITNAAQPVHPDERADLAERIEAAHEASLDDDHRACQSILKECLKMLAFPKAAPMTGPKVAFWVYEWLHPTDGSVTLRSLCPEDHCRKPDRAIPVPLMDEWVQWAKAAAPAEQLASRSFRIPEAGTPWWQTAKDCGAWTDRKEGDVGYVHFGSVEALRVHTVKVTQQAINHERAIAAAPAAPAEPVAPVVWEPIEQRIQSRYRVEPTGKGFWPYCVRAGNGERELYVGHKRKCDEVAAALTTACLDGAAMLAHAKHCAAAPAVPAQGVPAGFVLVPEEPTPEMLFVDSRRDATARDFAQLRRDIWAAMLAAAPQSAPQTIPQIIPAPAPAWQPIKTAPKDGTNILVVTDESYTCYVACWADPDRGIRRELAEASNVAFWRIAWDGEPFSTWAAPTHWMPLPAAPEASKGGGNASR